MGLKAGDKVRLIDDDPEYKENGIHRIGQKATVISVTVPGYKSVKLKDAYGNIFYARPCWLKKPNQADTKRETKHIKKEAAKMAEKRMNEIMAQAQTKAEEQKLPTFQEIAEKFNALSVFAAKETKYKGPNGEVLNQAADAVLTLAKKALFDEIKNGCRWQS